MGRLIRIMWIFVGIALYVIETVSSATPVLTLSSPTDHLRQGSTVILTCTIVNLEADFFDQGRTIQIARRNTGEDYQYLATWTPSSSSTTEPRFYVNGYRRPERIVIEFKIEEVTSEDASSYQCAAFDIYGWQFGSNRHTLEMMRPPGSKFPVCAVSWEGDSQTSLKLDCYAERSVPPPKLVWYRNGMQISDAVVFRDYMYYENVITLENVTSVDGNYVCRFYYSDGDIVDQRSCLVNKPQLQIFPENPTFVLGGSTKFSIFSQAAPAQRKPITCYRKWMDGEGQHHEQMDINLKGNNYAEITVRHVDQQWNRSEVSCSAENMVGVSTKNFTILFDSHDTLDEADVFVLPKDPKVIEGSEVSFVCIRPFVLKDFPIDWLFAGRKISKSNTDDRYHISNEGQALKVTYTELNDDTQIVSCQVHIDNGVTLEASTDLRVSSRLDCSNSQNNSYSLDSVTISDHFNLYWKYHKFLLLVIIVFSVLGILFLTFLTIKCLCCAFRKKYPLIEGFPDASGRIDSTSSKKYLLTEEGMLFGPNAMQTSIAADRPPSVLTLNRTLPEVPLKRLNSVSENRELKPPAVAPHDISYVDMHSSEEGSIPPPSYYSATLPVPEDIVPEHVSEMSKFPSTRKRERHPSGRVPEDSQYQDCDDVFCDPYQELEDLYRERAESNAYTGKK